VGVNVCTVFEQKGDDLLVALERDTAALTR
jgi:hypothetical protein